MSAGKSRWQVAERRHRRPGSPRRRIPRAVRPAIRGRGDAAADPVSASCSGLSLTIRSAGRNVPEHEQLRRFATAGQRRHDIQRRSVDPLQIFEDEDERRGSASSSRAPHRARAPCALASHRGSRVGRPPAVRHAPAMETERARWARARPTRRRSAVRRRPCTSCPERFQQRVVRLLAAEALRALAARNMTAPESCRGDRETRRRGSSCRSPARRRRTRAGAGREGSREVTIERGQRRRPAHEPDGPSHAWPGRDDVRGAVGHGAMN